MPTYVYECRSCNKVIEVDQRITADPLTDCESCGAKGTLKRVMQRTAVMFKGEGFHINDYSTSKTEPKKESPIEKPTNTPSESPIKPEPAAAPAASESKPAATAPKVESKPSDG